VSGLDSGIYSDDGGGMDVRIFRTLRLTFETADGTEGLAIILEMLGYWDETETEESRYKRNFAVELLQAMGMPFVKNRYELVKDMLNQAVQMPEEE